jgi:hypothetical protein
MKQLLQIFILLIGTSLCVQAQNFGAFKSQPAAYKSMNSWFTKTKAGKLKSSQVKVMSGKEFMSFIQKEGKLGKGQINYMQKDFGDLANIRVILTTTSEASCEDVPFGRYVVVAGNVATQRVWVYTACGRLRCELGLYENHYVRPCDQYFEDKVENQPCHYRACAADADFGCCLEVINFYGDCPRSTCGSGKKCPDCND